MSTTSRAVTPTAVIYLLAWLVGLLVSPQGPSPTAPDNDVRAYYAEHGSAVLAQSLLVHGIAGLGVLILAWSVPASRLARSWVRLTGTAAAAMSMTQVAFAVAAVTNADSQPASTSQHWVWAINHADTIKLVMLAGFVTAVSAGVGSRWLLRIASILAPMLVLGGATFVFDDTAVTAALNASLVVSLVMLLVWIAVLAVAFRRRRARPEGEGPGGRARLVRHVPGSRRVPMQVSGHHNRFGRA